MESRDERKAQLGAASHRRSDVPLEVGQSDFADELAGAPLLDDPIAESHQSPMTDIGQEPGPGSLLVQRLAADESDDIRVGPHCRAPRQIVTAMTAKAQTWGIEHRHRAHVAVHAGCSKGPGTRIPAWYREPQML